MVYLHDMIIPSIKNENTLFELEAFYNRLNQSIKIPLSAELAKLITQKDRNAFINYILTGSGSDTVSNKIIDDLVLLKSGDVLRIDKTSLRYVRISTTTIDYAF